MAKRADTVLWRRSFLRITCGFSRFRLQLFLSRKPITEKISPIIPIIRVTHSIPDEQQLNTRANNNIAIPNPIFFISKFSFAPSKLSTVKALYSVPAFTGNARLVSVNIPDELHCLVYLYCFLMLSSGPYGVYSHMTDKACLHPVRFAAPVSPTYSNQE